MDDALDLAPILDAARSVAREVGALLLSGWRGDAATGVRAKARADLVTDFDLRSEALIRDRIAARFPDHALIGEEEGGDAADRELVWYVDPIDGTTNFAHGHPFFCVSIALARRGAPIVGVVRAPALGIEWWATRGGGCFRTDAHRADVRCRVGACASIDDALLSTGFPAWRASRPDNNYRAFLALDSASHGVRRCGAAAIELAMVADGSYDAFWDVGLKAWDVAAGALFVEEAGGAISEIGGAALSLSEFAGRGGRVLATNGRLHDAIERALAGAQPLPPGVAGTAPDLPAERLPASGGVR